MEIMVDPRKQSPNGTWPTPRPHRTVDDYADPDEGLEWWEGVAVYVASALAFVAASVWTWTVFRGVRGLVRMVLK